MPIAGSEAITPARRTPGNGTTSRPVQFLAEMSRAMQAAAQAARDESVARLGAEAKQRIEEIQEQGTTGTTELRRKADDDVAATREWSKSEIARIREETDRRIADRKGELEADVERHVATIKRRTELVRELVSRHETELAAFMDRLMAEDDPAMIATLAQEAPEPPVLDDVDEAGEGDLASAAMRFAADDLAESMATDGAELAGPPTAGEPDAGDAEPNLAADATAMTEDLDDDMVAMAGSTEEAEVAAMAEDPEMAGAMASDAGATLSAAGAAAAEAEAMSGLDSPADRARGGASLDRASVPAGGVGRTELLVAGLASVAGIAGFKRELSRLPGVRSVGVSAGEGGEFVFAISHDPGTDLATGVPTIVAFDAQLTGRRTGSLLVTAKEPVAAE